jgi:O-antigen/teichoic acid export membrane protein
MNAVEQQNNRRIAKNTFYLYIRMFVTMAVGLYTSRVVLKVLGASDFGLYNVVGGILTMFTMLSSALTIGVQRFLSFAIGQGDIIKLKRTFSIAFGLHVCLAFIIALLAETIGLWFLENQMNIPAGRENAAFWIYQFTILGFMVNLIQVPFQSCLISHEEMNMYAYMSIYDVSMKLFIILLIQILVYDKLILYGGLILGVNVTSILIYNFYCRHRFSECTFRIRWDKHLTKEIAIYSGWNAVGGSLSFFTNQGINILYNIFCGTVVNAARGISVNVNQYIVQFITNFQTAVNPQIIKLYAAKEYDNLYKLVVNNGRVAEYLYLFLAIPTFIEIDYILNIWLGKYPEYTAIFVQLILIQSAENVADYPIGMLIHAAGKMKYPAITGFLLALIFPVSYILLKLGFSPVSVSLASAIMWNIQNIGDLYWAHHYTGIPFKYVLKEIYLNVCIGATLMFIVPFIISRFMVNGTLRFFVVGICSVLWSSLIIYFWGLTPGMRNLVLEKLNIRKTNE